MAVVPLKKHSGSNPRIEGIKMLAGLSESISPRFAHTVETRVVTKETFEHYLDTGKFPKADEQQLLTQAQELIALGDTKKLTVRRAYVVPNLANPPGPRFLGLETAQQAVDAVKEIFDFAIEHKYHTHPESIIEAFFYPFIDPPKVPVPLQEETNLPRGGYAVPVGETGSVVRVLAVYGNNEGVQSLTGVDEYLVDTETHIILEKSVPQKRLGLFTTDRAQDDQLKLPFSKQFSQVLSDLQVIEAALVSSACTAQKGLPQRVEFTSDGTNIVFNEATDYEYTETKTTDINITGSVIVISGPDDVGKIGSESKDLVYISKEVVTSRDYGTLNTIATLPNKCTVLYPGTSATAHAMRVLVDSGHQAFVVGNMKLRDGDLVQITASDSAPKVELLRPKTKKQYLVNLDQASLYAVAEVGGKASQLANLISMGYAVPNGYVLLSGKQDDEDFLTSKEFQDFIDQLSNDSKYAVRSTANVEDGENNAFAGQFHSQLHVAKADLPQAIKSVWQSAHQKKLRPLIKDLGIEEVKMAVLIQEMITPQYSGVIFGGNIETRSYDQVLIELTAGYAEGVVDGTAKIHKAIFDKHSRELVHQNGTTVKAPPKVIGTLLQMYLQLEDILGKPQDVEWTITPEDELYLLQTRSLKL